MDNMNLKDEIIERYLNYCNFYSNQNNNLDKIKVKNLMNVIIDIKNLDDDPKYLMLMKDFLDENKSISLKFANINFEAGISLILDCFSFVEGNILIASLLSLLNDLLKAFVVGFNENETYIIRYLFSKHNEGASFDQIYDHINKSFSIETGELKDSIEKLMDVHTISFDENTNKYTLVETVIPNLEP